MPALQEQMDPSLVERLRDMGVPSISNETASAIHIPKATLVLANMMPNDAFQLTENQWGEAYCTNPEVATEVILAKFPNDCREGWDEEKGRMHSRTENLGRYTPITEVRKPVNVLVVTGDNLEIEPSEGLSSGRPEPIPMEDIRYGKRLEKLFAWGTQNSAVILPACLGAHLLLKQAHGLTKQTLSEKIFGVYEHEILDPTDPIVAGLGDSIAAPHSRWGNVSVAQIEAYNKRVAEERQLKVLAASQEVGWLILKETLPNSNIRVYYQGHPEYDRDDLATEYERDKGLGQSIPANYFPDDDPSRTPNYNWDHAARVLNHNVLRESCRILRRQAAA